jgi:hypothetical protein
MDANAADRISKLLELKTLTGWERGFLESLGKSLEKWKKLTPKQHNVLQKVEANHSPEKTREREEWEANFTPEMRRRMKLVATYYARYGQYFLTAASRILADETYIPPQNLYNKMCLNKYAEGIVMNALSEPQFPVGTFAKLRPGAGFRMKDRLVLIISHGEDVSSHAKGAKPVCVLPVGSPKPIWTQERHLKRASRKKS